VRPRHLTRGRTSGKIRRTGQIRTDVRYDDVDKATFPRAQPPSRSGEAAADGGLRPAERGRKADKLGAHGIPTSSGPPPSQTTTSCGFGLPLPPCGRPLMARADRSRPVPEGTPPAPPAGLETAPGSPSEIGTRSGVAATATTRNGV